MRNFKDFNIAPKVNNFVGDKIDVVKLFNITVTVHAFKIEPSKKIAGTELLTLQITKGTEKRIVFISSKVMIDQIKRVPDNGFPFQTIIRGDNDYYEFT